MILVLYYTYLFSWQEKDISDASMNLSFLLKDTWIDNVSNPSKSKFKLFDASLLESKASLPGSPGQQITVAKLAKLKLLSESQQEIKKLILKTIPKHIHLILSNDTGVINAYPPFNTNDPEVLTYRHRITSSDTNTQIYEPVESERREINLRIKQFFDWKLYKRMSLTSFNLFISHMRARRENLWRLISQTYQNDNSATFNQLEEEYRKITHVTVTAMTKKFDEYNKNSVM
jgi:hypothetical protein